jgi:hypothetical protein
MIYILMYSIHALELITIIIGIYHYKKYKNTLLKYFLFFIIYGLFTELAGIIMGRVFKFPNYIVFNIYSVAYYIFNFWLFGRHFKLKNNRSVSHIFMALTTLMFILDTLFFQNIFEGYQSYTWFIGSIGTIIIVILFLIELLNSEAILNVKHLLIFWVAVGVFLFQLGLSPVLIATKYINYSNGLTYGYILLILNFITSLCYSLGFIWTKKNLSY